jgi:hypothetical protein
MIESINKKKADFLFKHDKFLKLSSFMAIGLVLAPSFYSLVNATAQEIPMFSFAGFLVSALAGGALAKGRGAFFKLGQKYLMNLSQEGQDSIFTPHGVEAIKNKEFEHIIKAFSELFLSFKSNVSLDEFKAHIKNQSESNNLSNSSLTELEALYEKNPTLVKDIYQTHFRNDGLVAMSLYYDFHVDLFLTLSEKKFTQTDEKIFVALEKKIQKEEDVFTFQSETMQSEEFFKALPKTIQQYLLKNYMPFSVLVAKANRQLEKRDMYYEIYEKNPFESITETLTTTRFKDVKNQNREKEFNQQQHILEAETNYNSQSSRKILFKKSMNQVKEFVQQSERMNHTENLKSLDNMYHYENVFHDELFYLKNDVVTFYQHVAEEFSLFSQLKQLNQKESDLSMIEKRYDILNQKMVALEQKLHDMLSDKIEETQITHTAHFKAKL